MALKIPTTQPERIAEVQRQATDVLHLLRERAEELRFNGATPATTARCREIVEGAPVEFRDEYTVSVLLTDLHHRLDIAAADAS